MGKQWKQWETLFSWGSKITPVGDCSREIKRCLLLGKKAMIKRIKKQRHYFANKGLSSQSYGFSSGHVWMWELNYKESWVPKNWCFWTVVLEKTLESPLVCKAIQPVHPKDQSWVFVGRTYAEAETPILWPPDGKSWLIGKDPDAGKDRGQEKWVTGDEMVGWHHWLDFHEFEQALGIGDGQGSLVCCSPCSRKESDPTERLNRSEAHPMLHIKETAMISSFEKCYQRWNQIITEGSKASLRQESLEPLPLCVIRAGGLSFDDLPPVTQAHPHRDCYPQHQRLADLQAAC